MEINLNNLKKPAKDNPKASWALGFGHFSIDTYGGFINPIMPFIAVKIGIAMTLATALISISHLCSSIIQPFFGYTADILKKRFFIVWGLILGAIFLSITSIASNPVSLGFFLVMGSIGSAFFHPQATGFVKKYSPENPTKYMSIFLACGTLGYSAGPLLSSFMADKFGLESIPILMIYGIISAILLLKFVPKISKADSFDVFKDKIVKSDFILAFFKAVKESFSVKDFRILFAVAVAKCLTVNSCCIFLPFLWQKMNYSVSKIGFLVFLFVSAGVFATIASPHFERTIGAKMVYYLSLLTTLPLMIIFISTYVSAPFISYTAIILTGFFALLAIPINMVMAQNAVPEHKGLIAGFIGGFSWGVVGILLPFTGFIAEMIGIPTLLILVSIVPLVCAFFVKDINRDSYN